MDSEREEYLNLKTKLYAIIDNIDITLDIYNTLVNNLIENILIDDKVPQEVEIGENVTSIKNIKQELKSIIYKEINNKL